jgi:hypothetical protein
MNRSATAIFADDIREDTGGQLTLTGIMSDNVNLNGVPGFLPKLCFYVRVHISPDDPVKEISVKIVEPGGIEVPLGGFDRSVIEDSRKNAREAGLPFSGMLLHGAATPFNVTQLGQLVVWVTIDGEQIAAGGINLRLAPGAAGISTGAGVGAVTSGDGATTAAAG